MFRELFIGLLLLSMGPVTLVVAADLPTNQKTDKERKVLYPPYPDVWDWQVPESDRPIGVGFKVKWMENGDVMIIYRPDRIDADVRRFSFFGKNKVSKSDTANKSEYSGDAKVDIILPSKLTVGGGGGGFRSGGCLDALGFFITLDDEAQNKHIFRKRLLEIFDKPKYYDTGYPDCLDGPSFYYQVTAVDAKFLMLKDGTFLMIVPEGYVIRFDKKFQTKSKLINDRFFWMDDSDMHDFESAKYGDRIEGHVNLKQLYSDLYQLLLKKRGEKR